MTIEAYITTSKAPLLTTDNNTGKPIVLDTLGPKEDAIALKFDELFSAISEPIQKKISTESTLTIEVTGTMTLKASGGVKYLLFNAEAGAENQQTLKVTLSTKLLPSESQHSS